MLKDQMNIHTRRLCIKLKNNVQWNSQHMTLKINQFIIFWSFYSTSGILSSSSINYAIFDTSKHVFLENFSVLKRPWINYTAKPDNLLGNLFCVLPLKFSLPQNSLWPP